MWREWVCAGCKGCDACVRAGHRDAGAKRRLLAKCGFFDTLSSKKAASGPFEFMMKWRLNTRYGNSGRVRLGNTAKIYLWLVNPKSFFAALAVTALCPTSCTTSEAICHVFSVA